MEINKAPPPPQIPENLLSPEPEEFAFQVEPGREILDMETAVVGPLQEDRLRLIRDRAQVRCILLAWRVDPWAEHGCAKGASAEP